MRVFVTGATGFIGSRLVPELIEAGHQVIGLSRSDAGAEALSAAGAQVQRGDLQDLDSLRSGASAADAVIHLAFIHDFSKFAENCAIDGKAIEALGEELLGSDRPLIVTSGVAMLTHGRPATEQDLPPSDGRLPRVSELKAIELADRGVRAMTVRLPQVHDTTKAGLISYTIQAAREAGVVVYVGEGKNRWAAAHVSDAAHLYRLALEKGGPGARYHAVAEEGVSARDIAEAIGGGMNLPVRSITPEEAAQYFGPLAPFAQLDLTASSAVTQQELGWRPTGPALLTDLRNMHYSA